MPFAEELSHFVQTRKVTETPRVNLPKSGIKDMATDDMLIRTCTMLLSLAMC